MAQEQLDTQKKHLDISGMGWGLPPLPVVTLGTGDARPCLGQPGQGAPAVLSHPIPPNTGAHDQSKVTPRDGPKVVVMP